MYRLTWLCNLFYQNNENSYLEMLSGSKTTKFKYTLLGTQ
jgi:hypothetical protein